MTEPEAPRKRVSKVSAVLLPLYAGATAWTFHRQSTAWPHIGSWAYLLLFLSCPGLVFHTVRLVFEWRTRRALPHPLLMRIPAIPLGLVLAVVLMGLATSRSMSRFITAHAPLVARITARLPDPCVADVRNVEIDSVAAYQRSAPDAQLRGRLHHDARRFVLEYHGGSADIDGSTVYYDSQVGAWHIFHNDDKKRMALLEHLTEGLKECSVGPGADRS